MKIKELIAFLETAPNKEAEVFIEDSNSSFTPFIGCSFDDNNDIQLYQIAGE